MSYGLMSYLTQTKSFLDALPRREKTKQEGLAVASIARDNPSTLPGDHSFLRARMHHDHNAR